MFFHRTSLDTLGKQASRCTIFCRFFHVEIKFIFYLRLFIPSVIFLTRSRQWGILLAKAPQEKTKTNEEKLESKHSTFEDDSIFAQDIALLQKKAYKMLMNLCEN